MNSIEEVLKCLDEIIKESETNSSPLGFFAVLYEKVTQRVKEGIEAGFFEDNKRMEKLDVIFASRYIDAYNDYKNDLPVSISWHRAFELSHNFWPISFQHLLIGMNAHINLDLGIAAAKVSEGGPIDTLEVDFMKINGILADMVEEVQYNLGTIWPPLRFILKQTGQLDNLLTDFSMKLARDGAWRFALTLYGKDNPEYENCIEERDRAVAKVANIIIHQKPALKLLFGIIRLGEIGTVKNKIVKLKSIKI